MSRPRLDLINDQAGATDLVVLAHGGQEHSREDPHDRRPSLLRMWPFAAAAHRAAPEASIGLIRYRYRGWNGVDADAMSDLRQVLDGLPARIRRVALIGHSMGGRAAMRCGDRPRVVGVLGLAPWLPEGEPVPDLGGRLVVTAHGDEDQMTSPRATGLFVQRLRRQGTEVAEFAVAGDTHALLHRHGDWDELVRRFVASCFGVTVDPELALALAPDADRPAAPLPRWSRSRGRLGAVVSIARSRARAPR
ncbi:MAG: alpha/beta fold hydrolase [Nocardioidaceae bacterium]